MPDNRQNQTNATSISSNEPFDNIKEQRRGTKRRKKEDGGQSKQYPKLPGEPDCGYYLRTGLCGYGSNCRFNHPPLPTKYYLKTGTCKYGLTCKYHHALDRRGVEVQEEKPCPYYMRTYTCKFGQTCKFNHPQPALFETSLPASGPAAVRTMGSILPSAGIPYVGALPAWSLTRSSYLPSSWVPSPQAYMSIVFPPLQGKFESYIDFWFDGHECYVQHTTKNQGELVASGQLDLLAIIIFQFPERPDHPECRYFMNIGSCKYGSNCKFHHPKESLARLATNSLGPQGLPLRPVIKSCAYYEDLCILVGKYRNAQGPKELEDKVNEDEENEESSKKDEPESSSTQEPSWVETNYGKSVNLEVASTLRRERRATSSEITRVVGFDVELAFLIPKRKIGSVLFFMEIFKLKALLGEARLNLRNIAINGILSSLRFRWVD
ncbi:hypothetical protein Cgig2_027793 [Carnegiea gigantea]|uniref:C3H1-type domain-containing protein n=1 Tax=Carnegiea gigantea TaxID=171969 RepID=A0A9Q1GL66_9CARY|nr:hypothetical protein Cgig2_027793 [Carnegiea gigantea]